MTRYVYIAGPLSDSPPEYLANVAWMAQESRDLMVRGYVTINPAADMLDGLMSAIPMPLDLYQERSMELLRLLAGRDDACLFVTRAEHFDGRESGGVRAEVEEAARLGIPIVWSRDELPAVFA